MTKPPASFLPIFWSVFALAVIYNAMMLTLAYKLKDKRHDKWLALGSPSLLNISPLTGIRLVRFIFSAEHGAFEDQTIRRLVVICRVLFVTCVAAFLYLASRF